MTTPTAYHQIGKFIVYFQHAEVAIDEILVLLAHADEEAVRILDNELLPEAFNTDFERLSIALEGLEAFRLRAVDWLYPEAHEHYGVIN